MKTYGLIWPDGQKELRSIVLDDEGNPRIDTLQPNPMTDDWQAPQIISLVKLPQPETGTWEPNVVWFDDRVERQWVAGAPAPAPTFTAEQHLESVGLGGNRQPTLLYLRQAGAVSAKLDATEQYLNQILAIFAANPAPRSDWPAPVYSFEETIAQAVASLSQP